eukprot:GFKZ01008029.1.p1 GENE.GFKZ01008029.1~~GFKZ01008029.1.p1  ORF type:complete len:218 (-),score=33.90 GFKZ01008029.1:427-1080(-)
MNRSMANRRMKRELEILSRGGAAPGIAAWPREEGSRLDVLEAEIRGAKDTPYAGGVFRLEVNIPAEYPLKPPRVKFLTKIYHPNIDSQGRICLDSLNMPPKGAWKPSLNVATLLTSIQALMSSPNGDDGLMVDITEEFRNNTPLYKKKATEWTKRYASGEVSQGDDRAPDGPDGHGGSVEYREDTIQGEGSKGAAGKVEKSPSAGPSGRLRKRQRLG